MHKLGRSNRDKVQQFIAITGASEKMALQALKGSDWNLEGAFDLFYSQPQIRNFTDTRHFEELYNRYKDPYTDMILVDGITLLCNDIQVDPQDIVMLVLSWHMRAATMCEFSKQEFISGLQALGVDSLEKFREKIHYMRTELKDEQKFREIYNFAFGWAKEKGQKSLALDTAIGMWQLLFAEKHWPLVEHWCQFLQARHNKAISRDTWAQLLEFAQGVFLGGVWYARIHSGVDSGMDYPQILAFVQNKCGNVEGNLDLASKANVDSSLSNYDADGAWPYLIDEFVEYLYEIGIVQTKRPDDVSS